MATQSASTSTNDIPYCRCAKGKMDGYKNLGNGIWAHSTCNKPTYLFWINQVLVNDYWRELDLIIEKIIEKRSDAHDIGRAEMACKFIAMLINPENPDPKPIRDIAIKRYNRTHNE